MSLAATTSPLAVATMASPRLNDTAVSTTSWEKKQEANGGYWLTVANNG